MNKQAKKQLFVENKKKYLSGEAGYAISKLCAGQATKNVLVDRSAEPYGGTLQWKDYK